MDQINDLTSQIKLANEKIKKLKDEKKDLEIIKNIHENCEKEKVQFKQK